MVLCFTFTVISGGLHVNMVVCFTFTVISGVYMTCEYSNIFYPYSNLGGLHVNMVLCFTFTVISEVYM